MARRGVQHIATATGSRPGEGDPEGRYGFVAGACREALTETKVDRMELSRHIDTCFTHRFLGCPIFLLLMWVLVQLTFHVGAYPMRGSPRSWTGCAAALCTRLRRRAR